MLPTGHPVATGLGGLFLLVDLALHLGLLADFSAPQDVGAGLDPWDLLTLIGTELVPDAGDDPVWPLLAGLSGRPVGPAPGSGVVPDEAWRLPPAWLVPWAGSPGTWTWSAARGRLRVLHPGGFLVLDVPGSARHLDRELVPYGRPRPLRRGRVTAPGRCGGPARRWARRVAPYVRARLRTAVGPGIADPVHLVLRRPARVHVSPTRVDVVLSLDEHPVEIRIAGLDRDPGWLPAAGRSLAFHFR